MVLKGLNLTKGLILIYENLLSLASPAMLQSVMMNLFDPFDFFSPSIVSILFRIHTIIPSMDLTTLLHASHHCSHSVSTSSITVTLHRARWSISPLCVSSFSNVSTPRDSILSVCISSFTLLLRSFFIHDSISCPIHLSPLCNYSIFPPPSSISD